MKNFLVVLLALAMAFSMAACGGAEPQQAVESTDVSDSTDRSDELYIQVSALSGLSYFYDHAMGCEMAGKELGVRTEYVGPADLDMNAMVAAFEQAIAKKPNGIVVVGFNPQLEPSIKKAMDAGIPVVTVDADLPNSERIAFVGTGNVTAGKAGGQKLADELGGKGKVILLYNPGQSNLEERALGYREVLANYPGIEIVEVVDTRQDSIIAAQNVATILQKYPDLAGIACIDGSAGSGAATAVREAGLAGKVKIIAMDRDAEIIDYIESGIISASVAQQTALMPYYAIQLLMNLNASKVEITSDNAKAGVLGVPAIIDTGAVIIDKTNAQYFKR